MLHVYINQYACLSVHPYALVYTGCSLASYNFKLIHIFTIHLICSHAQVFGFDVVISQIQAMAEDVQPLLAEFRDSGLLKEVDSLTRSLTQASEDLR